MFRLSAEVFFRALTLACAIALIVVAVLRILAHDRISAQILRLAVENRQLHDQEAVRIKAQDLRLQQLEREVFGAAPPAQAPPPRGPAAWQRNRDKELRGRIEALERWRYADR